MPAEGPLPMAQATAPHSSRTMGLETRPCSILIESKSGPNLLFYRDFRAVKCSISLETTLARLLSPSGYCGAVAEPVRDGFISLGLRDRCCRAAGYVGDGSVRTSGQQHLDLVAAVEEGSHHQRGLAGLVTGVDVAICFQEPRGNCVL